MSTADSESKEAAARPLGRVQTEVLDLLRADGAYIRRQTHEGWLRSWLWYDGRRLELGSRPRTLNNKLVDSLVTRGLLQRVPTDNVHADNRAGKFVLVGEAAPDA